MDDDFVDAMGGQTEPEMSSMAGLPTPASPGRALDDWLGSAQRIGRRGRGTIRGVALELSEELADLSLKDGDPSQSDVEFTT
jgi:hypothetical protein